MLGLLALNLFININWKLPEDRDQMVDIFVRKLRADLAALEGSILRDLLKSADETSEL